MWFVVIVLVGVVFGGVGSVRGSEEMYIIFYLFNSLFYCTFYFLFDVSMFVLYLKYFNVVKLV